MNKAKPELIEYARYECQKSKENGWTCGKVGISPHERVLHFKHKERKVCNANEKRIAFGISEGWIKFIEDLDIEKDIDEFVDLFTHSQLYGVTKKEAVYFDEKAHELRPELFPDLEFQFETKMRELDKLRKKMEERGEDDDQKSRTKRSNKKDRSQPIRKP